MSIILETKIAAYLSRTESRTFRTGGILSPKDVFNPKNFNAIRQGLINSVGLNELIIHNFKVHEDVLFNQIPVKIKNRIKHTSGERLLKILGYPRNKEGCLKLFKYFKVPYNLIKHKNSIKKCLEGTLGPEILFNNRDFDIHKHFLDRNFSFRLMRQEVHFSGETLLRNMGFKNRRKIDIINCLNFFNVNHALFTNIIKFKKEIKKGIETTLGPAVLMDNDNFDVHPDFLERNFSVEIKGITYSISGESLLRKLGKAHRRKEDIISCLNHFKVRHGLFTDITIFTEEIRNGLENSIGIELLHNDHYFNTHRDFLDKDILVLINNRAYIIKGEQLLKKIGCGHRRKEDIVYCLDYFNTEHTLSGTGRVYSLRHIN